MLIQLPRETYVKLLYVDLLVTPSLFNLHNFLLEVVKGLRIFKQVL